MLLHTGLQMAPDHRVLHDNRVFVYHRWLEVLAAAHDDEEATTVLAQATSDEPSPVWNKWRTRLMGAVRIEIRATNRPRGVANYCPSNSHRPRTVRRR